MVVPVPLHLRWNLSGGTCKLCLHVPPWNSLQDIWVCLVKWRKLMRRRRCHVTVKCRRISIPTSTQILKNGYIEDCYEKNSSKFSVNVVFITCPTICIICFLNEPLDFEIWPFKPWSWLVLSALAWVSKMNRWGSILTSSHCQSVTSAESQFSLDIWPWIWRSYARLEDLGRVHTLLTTFSQQLSRFNWPVSSRLDSRPSPEFGASCDFGTM